MVGGGSLGGWTLEEGKPSLEVAWAWVQEEERPSTTGVLSGPPQAHLSHRKLPSSTLGRPTPTLSAWGSLWEVCFATYSSQGEHNSLTRWTKSFGRF